jgi:hypothetical protein
VSPRVSYKPFLVATPVCTGTPVPVPALSAVGLASRWETDAVLKRSGAYLHYSAEDLQQDLATLGRLFPR